MRFGIFGDIHGNREALEAVLDDMQAQAVTHTVCVGDIVGLTGNPRSSLEMVRALGCPIVKGDHDEEASMELAAELYGRSALMKEQTLFLRSLPLTRPVNIFSIVHASLHRPEKWGGVYSIADAEASFQHQTTQVCFLGHTHVPRLFVREANAKVYQLIYLKIDLEADKKYLVNVGSVGESRDGDWRAAYVIFDSAAKTIELRRVDFNLINNKNRLRDLPPPGSI